MKLSLCIATYNEDSNIHYPLDSAYDLVDEVIIVDGGSTDKTVEIAKKYGKKVKVFIEENPPMFHINKQKAIERAKGEWILQLDADEELSKELKQEIASLLHGSIANKNNNKTVEQSNNVAFWIPRKSFFLTRFLTKGGQYPDYTIRLYRNGVARFPCKDVHENVEIISNVKSQMSNQIQSSNDKSNLTMKQFNSEAIGYLVNPILHYADPDFSRYLKRWDRYTTLEANQIVKSMKQWNNETIRQIIMFVDYFLIKPSYWFFLTYFRHLGLLDGFPGFVFSLFSSIRFWAIFIKWFQINQRSQKTDGSNQKYQKI